MSRMREVDQPVRLGPVAAHEWEPSSGRSASLGPWSCQVTPHPCGRPETLVGREERVMQRRLVGVDLGIASAHTVRILDETGTEVCRRRCEPTVASLTGIEAAALAGAQPGVRLEVVFEPTGPAWLPIAVFFTSRGHAVFRVSSAKAADLRRFLSRHAKSNGIDAETLARLPLIDPGGLRELELPRAEAAALDRRVR